MSRRTYAPNPMSLHLRKSGALASAFLLLLSLFAVQAVRQAQTAGALPSPIMHGYVPLPANDFESAIAGIRPSQGSPGSGNAYLSGTIDFQLVITNAATSAVIVYDQWEDGYEADPANPTQSTTLVFGDGDTSNGNAQTYCGTRCAGDVLPAGATLEFRNNVAQSHYTEANPASNANIRFDGRDKVSSTRGFVITAGGFDTSRSSLQAAIVPSFDTTRYGTSYTSPVGKGQDAKTSGTPQWNPMAYTGFMVQAAQNGTTVSFDTDGNGTTDITRTLNEGETTLVPDIAAGATVKADKPVQTLLITGNTGATYENRWYPLFPDSVLSNSYLSVASPTTDWATVNYLYNPNNTPIAVTTSCNSGCGTTINIPAKGTANFTSPLGQAVTFSTTSAPFIAIGAVGAHGGPADSASTYDWGFTLVPSSQLTTQALIGIAPSNSANPPSNAYPASGPVWVTAATNTTVYVNYDGRGGDCTTVANNDAAVSLTAGNVTRITDSNDLSMTGALLFTCDGTPIATAWGEDPANSPAGSPGFDAGYTILPFTTTIVGKTHTVVDDLNGDGQPNIGDTIEYTITTANGSDTQFSNIHVEDTLPAGVTYVPGSATRQSGANPPIAVADDTPPDTPFPFDQGGTTFGVPIQTGENLIVKYRATIDPAAAGTSVVNVGCVGADNQQLSCGTDTFDVPEQIDLELTKTVVTAPAALNDNVTYELTVTNDGPSDATGVVVTDQLPAGLTFVSATGDGSYNAGTGVWTIGNIADGASATIEITATVTTTGSITNTAQVTAADQSDVDSVPNNNDPDEDDQDSAVISVASGSIGDTVFEDTNRDGVQNGSEAGIPGVTVTLWEDTGSGYVVVDTTVTDGSGNYSFPNKPAGDYRVTVTPPTGYVYSTPDQDDHTLTDGETYLDADFGLYPEADLSLTKVADAVGAVNVGDTVVFTLTVHNDGPSDATGVAVTDQLPASLTYVSSTGNGTYDDATGVWTIGNLANGADAVMAITTTVNASGDITNVAQVSASDQYDPDSTPGNDVPTEDDQDSVTLGANATGVIGDTVFEDLDRDGVQDPGESGIPFVTVILSQDTGSGYVPIANTTTDASGNYSFGSLPPGDYQVTLQGVSGWATSTPTEQDHTLANGETYLDADFGLYRAADLSLTKVVSTAPAFIGDQAVFTITVHNDGPSTATNIEVTDVLPTGLTFEDAVMAGSDGDYDEDTGIWTIGSIGSGAEVTLTITVTVNTTSATNYAEVTDVDQFDPDSQPGENPLGDNSPPDQDDEDSASLQVSAGTIGDTVFEDANRDGVQNGAEAGIPGVTVTLWEDTGSGYVVIDTTITDGSGNYSFPGLTDGDYRVTITPPAGHVYSTPDQDDHSLTPGETYLDADFGLYRQADLSLTKTATPNGTVSIGDTVVFTLTMHNDGPSDATGVTVTDQLPAGLTYVSSTGDGTYNAATGLWTIGTIANGADATMAITTTVGAAGSITNVAQVTSSDQYDPDSTPGNNEPSEDDQDTVTIGATGGTIGDTVYRDLDQNGTQNGTEPGLAGVTVTLWEDTGSGYVVIDTTITDGSGNYSFTDLPPGDYRVTVTPPSGYVYSTPDHDDHTLPGGATYLDADFGLYPQIDLSLNKSLSTTPTYLGDTAVFDLTVANSGPAIATGVEVTDQLPAGLTFVSSTGDGTYDAATGLWTVGTIAVDGSATLHITVTVDTLSSENFAEVTAADQHDLDSEPAEDPLGPDNAPNQDDEDSQPVTVQASADLALVKRVTAAPTHVGDNVTFEVVITNGGPSDAHGVIVTDQLDALAFSYVSDDGAGAYVPATGIWTVGDLANGASKTLTITAKVLTPSGTNTAEVTAADEHDPDSTPRNHNPDEDDQASVPVTAAPLVDVSLDKKLEVTPEHLGETAVYLVSVHNDGPSPATGVVVTDQLPAGLTYVSDDSTGAYVPATGVWTVGTLGVGATATIRITVKVNALDTVNTAEVTATNEDDLDSTPNNHNPGEDDQKSVPLTVAPTADLWLEKSASSGGVTQGDQATFTIVVHNDGPSDATGVEVTDQLPAGVSYVSDDASGAYNPTSGVWTVGNLANGASKTLVITVKVTGTGDIANVAQVTKSDQFDPDSTPGNDNPAEDDQDTAGFSSDPLVDLSVAKTVSASNVNVGGQATYTVTVSNDGPSDATGVVVTDKIPAGLTWVSDTSDGHYDPATGLWTVGKVEVGKSVSIQITVTVDRAGAITNFAEVTAQNEKDLDSQPGENPLDADHGPDQDDEASVGLTGLQIDLEVGITADKTTVNVGDPVTYTVTLTNQGPSDATGTTVAVQLPAGVTPTGNVPQQGTFDPATGIWTVGTVPVGTTLTLEVTGTVTQAGPLETVTQVATANEPDVDSTPGNSVPAEDDQDAVVVTGLLADLSVTKKADTAAPLLGETITYTVVVQNDGPSDATGVVVTDKLPSSLVWVSDDTAGAYDPATGLWTIGTIASGDSIGMTVTAKVIGYGQVDNTAEVTSVDQPDPDSTPGNGVPTEDDQSTVSVNPVGAGVSGVVWLDTDHDGVKDPNEPAIPGATVNLFDEAGNLVASTVTGANGGYSFEGLLPGTYKVQIDKTTLPETIAGQTYDPDDISDSAHTLTLKAGEQVNGIDFGYDEPDAPTPTPPAPEEPPTIGPLPVTGMAAGGMAAAALALILAGLGLLAGRRRRMAR